MAAVPNTITITIKLCGVLADANAIIFDVSNASEMITNKVFNNNFNTFIYLKFSDVNKYWNTYGSLTVDEGRIRLIPRTKVNIRDFVHWVRDRIRMSEDPAETLSPTRDRDDFIERCNTHRKWMIDAEGMAKNAMPKTFTDNMQWIDWKVTQLTSSGTIP